MRYQRDVRDADPSRELALAGAAPRMDDEETDRAHTIFHRPAHQPNEWILQTAQPREAACRYVALWNLVDRNSDSQGEGQAEDGILRSRVSIPPRDVEI
ncbi:hypothetical protein KM043_010880 [Ampulex compressa]|nr:hypothetical protein KM043_010880 [Ampulex compressa]